MSHYPDLRLHALSFDVGRPVTAVGDRRSLTVSDLGRRMARFFADGQLGSAGALERSRATGARC